MGQIVVSTGTSTNGSGQPSCGQMTPSSSPPPSGRLETRRLPSCCLRKLPPRRAGPVRGNTIAPKQAPSSLRAPHGCLHRRRPAHRVSAKARLLPPHRPNLLAGRHELQREKQRRSLFQNHHHSRQPTRTTTLSCRAYRPPPAHRLPTELRRQPRTTLRCPCQMPRLTLCSLRSSPLKEGTPPRTPVARSRCLAADPPPPRRQAVHLDWRAT